MRRAFSLITIVVLILIAFSASNPFDSQSDNTGKMAASDGASTFNYLGNIIYGRFGAEKGVFVLNENNKSQREIFNTHYDNVCTNKDILLIYTNNVDESAGGKQKKVKDEIYLAGLNDNHINLILSDYSVSDGMAVSPDGKGFVFVGSKKNQKELSIYYMDFKDKVPKKIINPGRKIRDITFMDNNTLIYSKITPVKIEDKVNYIYQIYKCQISTGKEESFINSEGNDVNPVISPDGTKLIFLRMLRYKYTLQMMDLLKNNEITTLNSEDAVIGGSIKWSGDSSYIIYVDEYADRQQNGSLITKKKVKVYNASEKKEMYKFDNSGYIASISPDNQYIVYAECHIQNIKEGDKTRSQVNQVIYRNRLNSKKSEMVFTFPENGPYNLSINMLKVLSK